MKKIFYFALLLIIIGTVESCSKDDNSVEFITSPVVIEEPIAEEMRDLSSVDIVKDMGIGWNLGNSLDTKDKNETAWGNPKATKEMIDKVKKGGFKTLRLPVTWQFHMGSAPDYTIDNEWLVRVEEVAKYALDNDMYVIINVHHDDDWIVPTYDKFDAVSSQLDKVWTQIADHFKYYGDYLIFETINEPRHEGSPEEWQGGTSEGRDCVNRFHKTALNAIRSTGENNSKRHIMVSTYGASTGDEALNDFVIPNGDKRVIVSLHSYFPYPFCLGGTEQTWGTEDDIAALDYEFDKIYNKFISKGTPVVMGEWSATNQDNLEDRIRHADYYTKGCLSRGIVPIYWDNGGFDESGLLDRNNIIWNFPDLLNIITESVD